MVAQLVRSGVERRGPRLARLRRGPLRSHRRPLYRWGDTGTPLVVIPGDGTPVANQLAQKTYDDPAWGSGPVT